jgi:hypothetical protein
MTELLEKAIAEVSRLPQADQDRLAEWLLAELQSEQLWNGTFRQSSDELSRMAREALEEHRLGRTRELDPDEL